MGFNKFLSCRIRFVIYVTTLQAICTKCPECTSERVCTALNELLLWMCSSCNNMQKLKINSIYYNSVLIVMLCIWQSESLVMNIIVCPARDACWRDNLRTTSMKRFYCSATHKCISYDINNSRPIYTIYKTPKIFWNNFYPTWSNKILSFTLSIWVFLKV